MERLQARGIALASPLLDPRHAPRAAWHLPFRVTHKENTMERTDSHRGLRTAIAAALGLCLSLPLAAQDMSQGTRPGNRAD